MSTKRDVRHSKLGDDDQSQRYAIIGLTRGYTKEDVDLRAAQEQDFQPGLPAEERASAQEEADVSLTMDGLF